MKYTAQKFGCALLKKIEEEPFDVVKISRWCMQVYTQYLREIDDSLSNLLFELATMTDDSQFEYSREQLKFMAEKLIHQEDGLQNRLEFKCNDFVMVKKNVPKEYRPGTQGIIYWIQSDKTNSLNCFVKFSDDQIIEIPMNFLILFEHMEDS